MASSAKQKTRISRSNFMIVPGKEARLTWSNSQEVVSLAMSRKRSTSIRQASHCLARSYNGLNDLRWSYPITTILFKEWTSWPLWSLSFSDWTSSRNLLQLWQLRFGEIPSRRDFPTSIFINRSIESKEKGSFFYVSVTRDACLFGWRLIGKGFKLLIIYLLNFLVFLHFCLLFQDHLGPLELLLNLFPNCREITKGIGQLSPLLVNCILLKDANILTSFSSHFSPHFQGSCPSFHRFIGSEHKNLSKRSTWTAAGIGLRRLRAKVAACSNRKISVYRKKHPIDTISRASRLGQAVDARIYPLVQKNINS